VERRRPAAEALARRVKSDDAPQTPKAAKRELGVIITALVIVWTGLESTADAETKRALC
jgi:hypothetical protein